MEGVCECARPRPNRTETAYHCGHINQFSKPPDFQSVKWGAGSSRTIWLSGVCPSALSDPRKTSCLRKPTYRRENEQKERRRDFSNAGISRARLSLPCSYSPWGYPLRVRRRPEPSNRGPQPSATAAAGAARGCTRASPEEAGENRPTAGPCLAMMKAVAAGRAAGLRRPSGFCGAARSLCAGGWEGSGIAHVVGAMANETPDATALVVPHQGVRWSYSELHDRARSLASGFSVAGGPPPPPPHTHRHPHR